MVLVVADFLGMVDSVVLVVVDLVEVVFFAMVGPVLSTGLEPRSASERPLGAASLSITLDHLVADSTDCDLVGIRLSHCVMYSVPTSAAAHPPLRLGKTTGRFGTP